MLGIYEKSRERIPFIAVITGIYAPKIRSSVEPDMPGRNIAEIAIIPIKNNLIAAPIENSPKSINVPPTLPFAHVIPTTSIIPMRQKRIPLLTSFILSFSSFTINGIAPATNPMNKELTT